MAYIYMDNAAGTRILDEVYGEMVPFLTEEFGNPSSIHNAGIEPKAAVELARERVADLIGAQPKEIYFTSCGSESNNFAIKGSAWAGIKKGRHIVVSAIDHQSVLYSARALNRLGWEVTTVGADNKGFVNPDEVVAALREDTVVVSITHASNEIGTIEPIKEIAARVKEKGVIFHTDAVQAAGIIPVNVDELGVDMLSLSANSFYGPKGAAALYIRDGVRMFALIDGGIQERGRRGGTENVPAIAGLGKAAEIAKRDMESRIESTTKLRDKLMNGLEASIPRLQVNGDRIKRLPGNVHVSIEAVEGETMLFSLAGDGIMAASGSSCADKALKSSHVLKAIGCDPALANASILFTLGFENTEEEVDRVLEVLPPIIERFRSMSPLWKE
ncbi:MAG TPA: aminotransferase class V-fold PLP-dependent enzyme [bacterium]|nr:aminotransferase class V-fold PLP-dependent enzyme [bacterium]